MFFNVFPHQFHRHPSQSHDTKEIRNASWYMPLKCHFICNRILGNWFSLFYSIHIWSVSIEKITKTQKLWTLVISIVQFDTNSSVSTKFSARRILFSFRFDKKKKRFENLFVYRFVQFILCKRIRQLYCILVWFGNGRELKGENQLKYLLSHFNK